VAVRKSAALPFRGQARYAVLAQLSFGDELTGYAIHKRTEFSFRYFFGDIALSQVYRELNQLEELGWVTARATGGGGDRPARVYRLNDEGRSALQAWANAARFDPPTIRFPAALKVWLGDLIEIGDMRDALVRQQRYVDDMLDTIEVVDRGTRDEPRWLYPALVSRWSRHIWEATRDATEELIAELDKLEATGTGPDKRTTPARPAKKAKATKSAPTRRRKRA
jgi:DNA-binding PadR family transcriptional regulator